jgi:hypothetical protein
MSTRITPKVVVLLGGLLLLALPAAVDAQAVASARTLSPDEALDVALGSLEEPIGQRAPVPPGRQEVAPLFPPYKQQPPAAQEDFSSGTAGISPKGKKSKK